MCRIVIVGGGHAGAQLCASLIEAQFNGQITLVTEEPFLPYHRPPLSKTLIKDAPVVLPELRGEAFYRNAGVLILRNKRAVAVDRASHIVTLADNTSLEYDHLVLATGARARTLPGVADSIRGLHYLRTYADAMSLRDSLRGVGHLIILGGGFIGLELAATVRSMGISVTVIESGLRLLARAVSPTISEHLLHRHRESGIVFQINANVEELLVEDRHIAGVRLQNGVLRSDRLIACIGAHPDTTLAQAAGLACNNGIVVDQWLCTSDPDVSAIGDCAAFPYQPWKQTLRLESVQNANDQAKTLAGRLCGNPLSYMPVPWFWSDQGDVRLQITGLWKPEYTSELREGNRDESFSIFHYEGDTLRAVESINAPADHIAARRQLQATALNQVDASYRIFPKA
ncbi:rhodocoxin reductase [Paraburkholderia fungorum]|uniref:Rhodocoxin reductase n=1 Tax=Paraburkholderia fungorum TaxID=134537 RepID=A0AAU8T0D9_9BURK|nr:rhodocoxin reductase [Paraburkholderia fungorum]